MCYSSTEDPVSDRSRQRIAITIKKGAQELKFTAAKGKDMCSNAQSYTFDISEFRDVGDFFEHGTACAELGETTPSPAPCSAMIETSAASSLSSSLTDRACALQTDPPAWCPEPEVEEDRGSRSLVVPSLAVASSAFLAAAIGLLGFFCNIKRICLVLFSCGILVHRLDIRSGVHAGYILEEYI